MINAAANHVIINNKNKPKKLLNNIKIIKIKLNKMKNNNKLYKKAIILKIMAIKKKKCKQQHH